MDNYYDIEISWDLSFFLLKCSDGSFSIVTHYYDSYKQLKFKNEQHAIEILGKSPYDLFYRDIKNIIYAELDNIPTFDITKDVYNEIIIDSSYGDLPIENPGLY